MIYEFECAKCETHFTELRPVRDRDLPAKCGCGGKGRRLLSPVASICNSDSFPTQALRGNAFWRPDGRNLYMKERDFLEREAADDAMAKPDTVLNVAKRGETRKLIEDQQR